VRDAAAVLDAVAGPMPGDWWVAPPPRRSFAGEVGRPPGRLRIGLLVEEPLIGCPVHAECAAAVHRTARALESLGHAVEAAAPPDLRGPTGLGPAYLGVIAASGTAAALDAWSARTGRTIGPQDVEPHIWERAEQGRTYTAVQVHAALQRLAAGVGRLPNWWVAPGVQTSRAQRGFHLLLTPTMAQPPPPIGTPHDRLAMTFGLFTLPFSYTGQPAISLPLHWTPDGLPVGVQLVAAFGREDLLLRVAAQLEQALPWSGRLPPVHAAHSAYD